MSLLSLILVVVAVVSVIAEYGVDISAALSSNTASCFASNGITFIVPRGYRSSGSVDTNVCTSLNAAANAGIKKRDVYLFPCKLLIISS